MKGSIVYTDLHWSVSWCIKYVESVKNYPGDYPEGPIPDSKLWETYLYTRDKLLELLAFHQDSKDYSAVLRNNIEVLDQEVKYRLRDYELELKIRQEVAEVIGGED